MFQGTLAVFLPITVIGQLISLLHMCLLYSLYAFEYKWFSMGEYKWFSMGEYKWFSMGEYKWFSMGEYKWFSMGEYKWFSMGEYKWFSMSEYIRLNCLAYRHNRSVTIVVIIVMKLFLKNIINWLRSTSKE